MRSSELHLTWTFAWQSAVRLWIRDPDTPGGFNASMAWRPASSSATAEDMMKAARRSLNQINNTSAKRWFLERLLSKSCALHQSRSRGYDEVMYYRSYDLPDRPSVTFVTEAVLRDEKIRQYHQQRR